MSVLFFYLPGGVVLQIILGILLLGVSIFDLRTHRVPNLLTFPLFFFALIYHGFQGHMVPALLGGGMGFIWLVIPYLFGWVGAGDVKLLTGIGAWMGWPAAWPLVLFAGALGGPLVLVISFHREDLLPLWLSLAGGPCAFLSEIAMIVRSKKDNHVPYAFSIFLGFSALSFMEKMT